MFSCWTQLSQLDKRFSKTQDEGEVNHQQQENNTFIYYLHLKEPHVFVGNILLLTQNIDMSSRRDNRLHSIGYYTVVFTRVKSGSVDCDVYRHCKWSATTIVPYPSYINCVRISQRQTVKCERVSLRHCFIQRESRVEGWQFWSKEKE